VPLYRRTWLKLLAHSPWLLVFYGKWAGAQQTLAVLPTQELMLLVDTLVPADESPGAVALGIHTAIETSIRAHANYQELLLNGVAWLDRESERRFQARFSELPGESREFLLTVAENSPRNSAQRRLFTVLRKDVIQRYYTDPEAWVQLGFQGPPQPLGFMDFSKPPAPPHA
jgi:hypothetical protein